MEGNQESWPIKVGLVSLAYPSSWGWETWRMCWKSWDFMKNFKDTTPVCILRAVSYLLVTTSYSFSSHIMTMHHLGQAVFVLSVSRAHSIMAPWYQVGATRWYCNVINKYLKEISYICICFFCIVLAVAFERLAEISMVLPSDICKNLHVTICCFKAYIKICA